MDLDLTAQQHLLRSTAREVLRAECPPTVVRETVARGDGLDLATWGTLASLGWAGLPLPSEFGGSGLGATEVAIVGEELGSVLLPCPYLSSVVLAGSVIDSLGTRAQRREWIPGIADGSTVATVAFLEESARLGVEEVQAVAQRVEGGWVLNGRKTFVVDGAAAHLMVALARTGDHPRDVTAFLIDTTTPGVDRALMPSVDTTRQLASVELRGVRVDTDATLGPVGVADGVLQRAIDHGGLFLAGEMLGGACRVLQMSVDHAKQREQFGRPIGSFQAVAHQLADVLLLTEHARSLTYWAGWAMDHAPERASAAVSMAKAWGSRTYRTATRTAMQVHGGTGFTWEHDLHLYLKRADGDEQLLGSSAWHDDRIAALSGKWAGRWRRRLAN